MKRAHRTTHKITWLVLATAIAAIIWFAVTQRPPAPSNEIPRPENAEAG